MRLFHGTSKENVESILRNGIERTDHEEWGATVCALDSLKKAKGVAAYFGKDGVVIEFEVPDSFVRFHPDYGFGTEFDTIHVTKDINPSRIINIIDSPSSLESLRPVGKPLRKWKEEEMEKDPGFSQRLNDVLDQIN